MVRQDRTSKMKIETTDLRHCAMGIRVRLLSENEAESWQLSGMTGQLNLHGLGAEVVNDADTGVATGIQFFVQPAQ